MGPAIRRLPDHQTDHMDARNTIHHIDDRQQNFKKMKKINLTCISVNQWIHKYWYAMQTNRRFSSIFTTFVPFCRWTLHSYTNYNQSDYIKYHRKKQFNKLNFWAVYATCRRFLDVIDGPYPCYHLMENLINHVTPIHITSICWGNALFIVYWHCIEWKQRKFIRRGCRFIQRGWDRRVQIKGGNWEWVPENNGGVQWSEKI